MRKFWAAATLAFFVLLAGLPAGAAPFDSLKNDAAAYLDGLRKAAPPDPKGDARKLAARKAEQEGDAALKAGDAAKAITLFEQALGLGAPVFNPALKLSQAWGGRQPPSVERALQAAYIAVTHAANTGAIGTALWRLADIYESAGNLRLARAALNQIAQKVADDPQGPAALLAAQRDGLQPRLLKVRRALGLAALKVRTEVEGERPRICIDFDEPLDVGGKTRFEDFVSLTPAPAEMIADADGAVLCLGGLTHGAVHRLTVREGLPGKDGVVLKKTFTADVVVPDRQPRLEFRGQARILPRVGPEGIPFVAVNVDKVAIRIYRINDRALTPYLREQGFSAELGTWEADQLGDNHGELVWRGGLTVPTAPNKETISAIPFAQAVPKPQPGVYAVVIDAEGVDEALKPWGGLATQWVHVTDLALTTMSGGDGLNVFVRALSDAKPLPKTTLTLVARNNQELARAETDANGRAAFAPGLMNGDGGKRPFAVMAYRGDDFVALNLTLPAFDLSDRGVSGRPQPGPLDAFMYLDRGLYRQGETVNLSALLRDDRTQGVDDFPLTIKVYRPSGTEYLSRVVTTKDGGGAVLAVPLSATAPLGGWRVAAFADPNRPPVGSAKFTVDDFVPERLALELEPSAPWIGAGDDGGDVFEVTARGRFLYGAPAANLPGTADMRLEADPAPFPGFADYAFGLPGESWPGDMTPVDFGETDENGVATLPIELSWLPDVTTPLRVRLFAALSEPGGRPTKAALTIPVRRFAAQPGVRLTEGGSRVKEGAPLRFDLVALGRDGKPLARKVNWRLVRERAEFQWFFEEGRYRYRSVRHDETVAEGKIDVAAAAPATLEAPAPLPGRYRLEAVDDDGGASAKRFTVGWEPPDDPADTPDALEITADKPAYRSGETAKLRIIPPFAGQMLLTVATDRLHLVKTMEVPADGLTVELPVDAAAWGPGAYATAVVYRPPQSGMDRKPVRALGLVWLGVDPAERTLKVALDAPQVARPGGPQSLTLTALDEAGKPPAEPVHVTLAAVDEGILRLTRFQSPDPGRHFFGKRALGVDVRDDYGRLIQPFDGVMPTLRQGGDASGAGLPAIPFQLVSLFQGPVKLDAAGKATLTFDLPDFNGELRLMAVAYSAARVGSAAQPMTVRAPLTAEAYLPRFLAPGDQAQGMATLHNVDGAAGRYKASVAASGALALEGAATREVDLKAGERLSFPLSLKGGEADGVGELVLTVTGPGGFRAERRYGLTVRSPRPIERKLSVAKLAPGEELRLSAADLAGLRPDSASLTASFGTVPPFDLAGILKALYRYPYGCVEQTASIAMSQLLWERLEKASGVAAPDKNAADRAQKAISNLLDRQRSDGGFSRWGAADYDPDYWLSAYVAEFLTRARQAGRFVPDGPLKELLTFLERHAVDGGTEDAALASRAYALYALTLAGTATASPVRYYHDAFLDRLPSPLAKAQIAAALAAFGDRSRAEHAFNAAVADAKRKPDIRDFGSTARDAAALIRLGEEAGLLEGRLDKLLARLPADAASAARTSTQEQAWLLLAADALVKAERPGLKLTAAGAALRGRDPATLTPDAAQLAAGVRLVNSGTAPIWRAVSTAGAPVAPPAAAAEGLTITRQVFDRAGKPLDPANLKQNDVFVVVLEGKAHDQQFHQAAVSQLLPAGWEVERALTDNDRGEGSALAWLGELNWVERAEARDDRFFAALDIAYARYDFRVAFLARAVTPGTFELPGAMVEDMYQPRFFARTAWGRATVTAAGR